MQRLLGDTITLGDRDWQMLTLLPGWTRGHVATHLAHHGEALAEMALQLTTDSPVTWRTRLTDAELNAGARRSALGLQEALDQSSARLMSAFDLMDDAAWKRTIETAQGPLPAGALVVARLNEVIIHHIDLRLGLDFADLDPRLTRPLLQWNLFRSAPRFAQVDLTLISDEGFTARVGSGAAVTIRGSESRILGWLTGRRGASAVLGAEDLDLNGPL